MEKNWELRLDEDMIALLSCVTFDALSCLLFV